VPGSVVDQAIGDLLLELVPPITLAVQQEVEARITETGALRRKHVERAQYEAELARRRYMSVDRANRLVADSLEAEWNNKLRLLAEAQTQYDRQTQKQRLPIEDATLINRERIQVHVRLRGGATRSLAVAKPLPIAQIRKTKPEVVAEIGRLLDQYCDREVADLLNQQGKRTSRNEPFNLGKIAHIRHAFQLECRYIRLRAKGLLTAREMSERHGVQYEA
jgi:hypothetical protein